MSAFINKLIMGGKIVPADSEFSANHPNRNKRIVQFSCLVQL